MAARLAALAAQARPDGHCDPDPLSRPKSRVGDEWGWWGPWLTDADGWCYRAPTAAPTGPTVAPTAEIVTVAA